MRATCTLLGAAPTAFPCMSPAQYVVSIEAYILPLLSSPAREPNRIIVIDNASLH